MDNVFENTNCIVCSEQNGTPFLTVQDRLGNSSHIFNLIKCNCGFIYLNPRPSTSDMGKYYQSANYDPHKVKSKNIKFGLQRQHTLC